MSSDATGREVPPDGHQNEVPAGEDQAAEPAAGEAIHPALEPLRFLLGRWEGAGVVGYPTIESAQFGQEITFSQNGKPFLIYSSRSWLLDERGSTGRPLAIETGYWRPQPDGQLEVLLAHPTGIAEIYLGQVTGTKIEMATDVVMRTSTAKEVTAGRRLYGLIGSDLGYAYDMAAMGHPLQAHASAQLKRSG
jgi:THAP4-like, heme-binding beta-barrel domain